MLDDTADVEQGEFRQTSITITCKQVLAILPNRLVNVHTRTVIANYWLRHKGCCLAISMSNVMNDIFLPDSPVSALCQCAELGTQFVLTLTSNFMVMNLIRPSNASRRLWHHFMPNTVTSALPFRKPCVSYQKSIRRMLRLPTPFRSITRLSPPCAMFWRMSILSGAPLS